MWSLTSLQSSSNASFPPLEMHWVDKFGPWGLIALLLFLAVNWIFGTLTKRLDALVVALDSFKTTLEADKERRRVFETESINILKALIEKVKPS